MLVRWRKLENYCATDGKSRMCAMKERRLIVSDSDLQQGNRAVSKRSRDDRAGGPG